MGTGKTALGRKLSEHWKCRFIDSDAAIEANAGLSIPEIFRQEGEKSFRQRELAFLKQGHPEKGCVVSLGGGTVCQKGVIELLRQKGVLICLFASPKTIYKRIRGCSHRPLLNVENPQERIRELLEQRDAYYRKAGIGVLTDGRTISELVAQIERIYRRESRRFISADKDKAAPSASL